VGLWVVRWSEDGGFSDLFVVEILIPRERSWFVLP
jgi:hypothetical protein